MTVSISSAAACRKTAQESGKNTGRSSGSGAFTAGLQQEYAAAGSTAANNAPASRAAVSQAAAPAKINSSKADMSMEEYRKYIGDKISGIPYHPSQAACSVAVTISDEGLEAMKNDPEYEKWVLDGLKADFAVNNPWASICGLSYTTHYFGATKEEYHGEGWYPLYNGGTGTQLYEAKSAGSLWERVSSVAPYPEESSDDPTGLMSTYEKSLKSQKNAEDSFWENRVKMHKKNMKLIQKDWERERVIENQQLSSMMFDPDGKKAEYLRGVPASVLLSVLS